MSVLNFTYILSCLYIFAVSSVLADFQIRLVDGATLYEGRLEISYGGQWGKVCNDNWDKYDAEVVCRELGFGGPVRSLISFKYQSNRKEFFLDEVRCTGSEARLSMCSHDTSHDCGINEDVAVECSPVYGSDFNIRLVDGLSYPNVGRLKVSYHREWHQVCDSQWTKTNSDVACKQLGYLRSDDYVDYFEIKSSSGSFLTNITFNCDGIENKLVECNSAKDKQTDCKYPVKLQCTNEDGKQSHGDARLVGSGKENEGIAVVFFYGTWGTVRTTSWTKAESDVLCKQLGFRTSSDQLVSIYNYDTTEIVSLPSHDVTFYCNGDENHLNACEIDKNLKSGTSTGQVALTCHGNSGFTVATICAIVFACIVLIIIICCLCRQYKLCQRASETTTSTSLDQYTIESQSAQAVPTPPEPSAPPAINDDLPPSYDVVMQEREGHSARIITPPPEYEGLQPSFNQGV